MPQHSHRESAAPEAMTRKRGSAPEIGDLAAVPLGKNQAMNTGTLYSAVEQPLLPDRTEKRMLRCGRGWD